MRNMNAGDKAFFYHSNCKEPGIAGIMEIVKEFSEDSTFFFLQLLFLFWESDFLLLLLEAREAREGGADPLWLLLFHSNRE